MRLRLFLGLLVLVVYTISIWFLIDIQTWWAILLTLLVMFVTYKLLNLFWGNKDE